ncbi:MAG TPA: RNA polymerase sigma-54 factor, partial [Opitutae bacterium]|nr:RNA polymerase sigma-54 factor [Opitutae bacterium]
MSTLGFKQVQKLSQTQVLAPQLRQSLKILQAPALELRDVILEELETNPVLEELPMAGVSIENAEASPQNKDERESSEEMNFDEDYRILQQLDEDWREHFSEEKQQYSYSSEDASRREHMLNSLVSETSLQDHLIQQADMANLTEGERTAFTYLIGSLDDHGFLTTSLDEIATLAEIPLESVESACELLKRLDPPGLGCKNIQESLLYQLKLTGKENTLATTILKDHYKLLLRRRIPELAKHTEHSIDQVQKALELIATLDPSPGRKFAEDTNRIVMPDVRIHKDDGTWSIVLENEYIPKLRLSRIYKDLVAQGKVDAKEQEYIRDKIRSAKHLIHAIEQRQQTLERITQEILKHQGDFFHKGVSALHPLKMSEIADILGIHETTVSRAIANKYMETPHGVVPFKFFFTSGYTKGDGEALANTSIKDEIAHIIEAENP